MDDITHEPNTGHRLRVLDLLAGVSTDEARMIPRQLAQRFRVALELCKEGES